MTIDLLNFVRELRTITSKHTHQNQTNTRWLLGHSIANRFVSAIRIGSLPDGLM